MSKWLPMSKKKTIFLLKVSNNVLNVGHHYPGWCMVIRKYKEKKTNIKVTPPRRCRTYNKQTWNRFKSRHSTPAHYSANGRLDKYMNPVSQRSKYLLKFKYFQTEQDKINDIISSKSGMYNPTPIMQKPEEIHFQRNTHWNHKIGCF